MSVYSFDIVSEFDKGEMINVHDQAMREINVRYDFKGTDSKIDWLPDKKGFQITTDSELHLEAIIDIIRKKAAARNVSQKTFDTDHKPEQQNFVIRKQITFREGLDQEKIKKVTVILRNNLPKIKTNIQGETVRVMSAKKDELQEAMRLIKEADLEFPIKFNNFR